MGPLGYAGSLAHGELDGSLQRVVDRFPARVGVCAVDSVGNSCVNGQESFSLQSVMKLVVSLAALDAVDRHALQLNEQIVVHREDLSLYVQPLADLVGAAGYTLTLGDLIHRAIVDSDSAAADILIRRLGGVDRIQQYLNQKMIKGVRIDRDERHLQTEIVGLTWRPEYVNADTLEKAIAGIPAERRAEAYHKYQRDLRDTATPLGMALLLQRLASGELLSPGSTRYALATMAQTVTFPDRLKAGVPDGWICMHKTGTSGSWDSVTAATNDVAILKAPDGTYISLVVFIADTRQPANARSRVMRKITSVTVASFR
jgi:beta-lactamase class A